jgi:hypothetical protein
MLRNFASSTTPLSDAGGKWNFKTNCVTCKSSTILIKYYKVQVNKGPFFI